MLCSNQTYDTITTSNNNNSNNNNNNIAVAQVAQYQQKRSPSPVLLNNNPHDPNVEKEYESLIRAWKHQLIDNTPTSPNTDYIRFAWIRLMDHYLDQQWLDSKQMLQCAQAWSARDELSLTEAVHTMNILSLKFMQRSLDARQELLQILGDPDLMAGFGISISSSNKNQSSSTRYSTISSTCSIMTAGSLEQEEEDVHAPLFVKHKNSITPTPVTIDEAINTMTAESYYIKNQQHQEEEEYLDSNCNNELGNLAIKEENNTIGNSSSSSNNNNIKEVDADEEQQIEIKTRQTFEELEISEQEDDESDNDSRIYTRSISSSMSSPNLSTFYHGFTTTTRKYESCYQRLNQTSSWKEIEISSRKSVDDKEEREDSLLRSKNDENDVEDHISIASSSSDASSSSQLGSPLPLGDSSGAAVHQWKSWFLGNNNGDNNSTDLLLTEEFANEKVETDAITYPDFHPEFVKKHQPFLMIRSESSISTFRPISNNLAPRCHQQQQHQHQQINQSLSSLSSQEEHQDEVPSLGERSKKKTKKQHNKSAAVRATLTKSKSFPTKASLLSASIIKKPFLSSSSFTNTSSLSSTSVPPLPSSISCHQQQSKEQQQQQQQTKSNNFMIRSIVSKKVSLSKLFSHRKGSSSSIITT